MIFRGLKTHPSLKQRRSTMRWGISLLVVMSLFCVQPMHLVSSFSTPAHLVGRTSVKTVSRTFVSRYSKCSPLKESLEREVMGQLSSTKSSEDVEVTNDGSQKQRFRKRYIPQLAVRTYTDYFSQLWSDTNPEVRKLIAKDKAAAAVRKVQHLVKGEEYVDLKDGHTDEARKKLLDACTELLDVMDHNDDEKVSIKEVTAVAQIDSTGTPVKKKKKQRSILFGAMMGAVAAGWVFSGNYIFTGVFTLMTILGQLEYYRMVINTGVYPARRISVVGACSMFLTALFAPNLHQICLPAFAMWAMVWFLTMRREVSTIAEIATTFTGMFYLGYIPSFWVRIRLIGADVLEPTRLAPILGPILVKLGQKATSLPAFLPKAVHLPITTGSLFIFWSWLCLAFSDVGAYFVGRAYGRTKLGQVSAAAGATSPNKTVEGVYGGCAVSGVLGIFGAWVQRWPYFVLTGAIHGVVLALLGLVGDLTASMIKRDAGIKDFGNLIPEHGGILDRVDSFIFSAPYSWLVCAYIIPALKKIAKARAVVPL